MSSQVEGTRTRRSVEIFSLTKSSFLRESRDDFFDAYSSFKAWKRSSRRESMRVNNAELHKNLQRWVNHLHLVLKIRTEPLIYMNLGRTCHPIDPHCPSVHLLHYKHWYNGLIHCVQH